MFPFGHMHGGALETNKHVYTRPPVAQAVLLICFGRTSTCLAYLFFQWWRNSVCIGIGTYE